MWSLNFGDDSGAGGFFNSANEVEDSPEKEEGVRLPINVFPVVVKQLKECPDDEFTMFGMPAQILCLVGVLQDYEVQSTKVIYNIQDHTGTIKAIWWLENDKDNQQKLPDVKEKAYVQLFGTLKVQDDEKMIMALRMFPVDDCNVVTNHLLQVIQVRLECEHLANNPTGPSPAVKKNNPGAELAISLQFFGNSVPINSLTSIQTQVHQILRRSGSISGTSKSALLNHFPQNKAVEVMEALEFLITEGHVYSTIDTEHFKATDPM